MNIQHSLKGKKGTFFIAEHGDTIARMVYRMEDESTMVIIHTEVIDAFEGNGVGESLLMEAVDFARKTSVKIKAQCSFAKSLLEKDTKYNDVYVA